MKTSNFKTALMTNKEIYKIIMESKSFIDTIAEEKSLDENHDLCLASNHLDNFLNALEEQCPEVKE